MWSSTLQINWKQRFFVPTEEEPGIAILAALLEQFPVIATEDEEADSYLPSDVVMSSANTTQSVDLETWFIEPAETHSLNDVAKQKTIEMTGPTSYESEPTCTQPPLSACLPIDRQASAAMRQSVRPDYRTAAI